MPGTAPGRKPTKMTAKPKPKSVPAKTAPTRKWKPGLPIKQAFLRRKGDYD
jgi:hypothetical protein